MMSISTAPVTIASSCCRKLPATGMPWRIRISLAVQQMPARVTPSAPAALASATISGSREAMASISDSAGSWPCTMMFTVFAPNTPRLARLRTGEGVPKRISETMEAMREPPQPSASEVRKACSRRLR